MGGAKIFAVWGSVGQSQLGIQGQKQGIKLCPWHQLEPPMSQGEVQ